MTRLTIFTVTMAATLVLAACERDGGNLAGPRAPSTRAVATEVPATPAAPVTGPKGVVVAGDPASTQSFTDSEGHTWSVNISEGSTSHFRDGVLYATTSPTSGGDNVAVFLDGALFDQQVVSAAGVAGARAVMDSLRLDDPLALDRNPRRPQLQMYWACGDELQGYLVASGEMIAAALWLQRNPTNRKARSAYYASIVNWAFAWKALYHCELVNG